MLDFLEEATAQLDTVTRTVAVFCAKVAPPTFKAGKKRGGKKKGQNVTLQELSNRFDLLDVE